MGEGGERERERGKENKEQNATVYTGSPDLCKEFLEMIILPAVLILGT